MKSKEIKEYVEEKGFLHLIVLFEVVGNPKDHVEKMLQKVLEGIKSNKDVKIINEDLAEAEDAGEGLWSTFCETELLAKDIKTLSWIAFNFAPASIELKAPDQITIKDKVVTDFFGDLLSQLHQNNMNSIKAKNDAKGLLLNFNTLMRNAVLISLKEGDKPAVDLARSIGMEEKGIIPLLDAMIKEKTIAKNGENYKRIK